ncbi:MAG: alpha-glucuronidase [Verrucomicrobia bacterium]|nr:alpha-glucuronidase [Verrucomicrobiota bacterium]
MTPRPLRALFLLCSLALVARADDGYRLWLRYDRIADESLRRDYAAQTGTIFLATPGGAESPTIAAARDELTSGLAGLLGTAPKLEFIKAEAPAALGPEGYSLRATPRGIEVIAARDLGVLYGSFALLRLIQTHQPLGRLAVTSAPKIQHRMLNHWDNLNRSVERGYAGQSLWEWDKLPGELSPRYRDYARACASLGLNGTVLVNVNANAQFLTPAYLAKAAALAGVFRPYGLRVYLTARFSAPIEIGGLKTADPLDPAVIKWWHDKATEIYRAIPDFGGFLVKANSEGQPGPQNYQRTHADGANLLAGAVAPHGGIVIWRAFVYDANVPDDRHKQAYNEFVPLDGRFRDNVVIQVKNGAIDFMPREPFHPLFGAMPRTPLALELQITQEYLGGSTQLAFLAPMWKEVLDADTFRPRAGATVARVIDGTANVARVSRPVNPADTGQETRATLSVIAGVANTGTDRNWSGHPLAPSNWYAYGRLAWDHTLTAAQIADEWTRLTFGNDARVVPTVTSILLASRETVVDYSMPLGLHHIMARNHHQGPGPWVAGGRPDWTSLYYHRADEKGVGFDRTTAGSNALGQYAPEVARRWADLATCPDRDLLWFHHLPWDHRMRSGNILWDDICLHYQRGVDTVRSWQKSWDTLAGAIDEERFKSVQALFARQEREARIWRDACTQYFATFAKRPLPAGVEPPAWTLGYLRSLNAPFTATAHPPAAK